VADGVRSAPLTPGAYRQRRIAFEGQEDPPKEAVA
jgi:hypothetical protein